MGEETLGRAVLALSTDDTGLDSGLKSAEGKTTDWVGRVGKIVGALAIAAGIAKVGQFVFDAGMQMDEAMDTLAIKTGAVGPALDGLTASFKAVFTSVPTDAKMASDAIGELNRRTGMTGPLLENTTKTLLEFSRITGGDATANAGYLTRVMGDWGLSNKQAAGTLDKLFVASQKTGVNVDALMQKVVQFGAPMRLMGFSIDDSIALFAKWEKEGVNAELVMGSLRIAAGKFAKAGQPLKESLMSTFAAIKNNTSATAALAKGMDVFGARAGPDMVAAIREGRFSIDDLVASLGKADGAITNTAFATMDFPEKLTMVTNKLSVAFAPLGLAIMDVISMLIDDLGPTIDAVGVWLGSAIPNIIGFGNTLSGVFSGNLTALGDFSLMITDTFTSIGQTLGMTEDQATSFGMGVSDAFDKVRLVVEALVANWGNLADTPWSDILPPGLADVAYRISAAIVSVTSAFQSNWPIIKQAVTDAWNQIKGQLGDAYNWFKVTIPEGITFLKDRFNEYWPQIKQAVTDAWNTIKEKLGDAYNWLKINVPEAIMFLKDRFNEYWPIIKQAVLDAYNAISTPLSDFVDYLKTKIPGAATATKTALDTDATPAFDRLKLSVEGATTVGLIMKTNWWDPINQLGPTFAGTINSIVGVFKALHDVVDSVNGLFSKKEGGTIANFNGLNAFMESVGNSMLKRIVGFFADAQRNIEGTTRGLQEFKKWLNGITIPSWLQGGLGGLGSMLGIPHFATGTSYAPGGFARVGENGPEVVALPRGSQVYPNGQGPSMGDNITNNIYQTFAFGTPDATRQAAYSGAMSALDAARARGLR